MIIVTVLRAIGEVLAEARAMRREALRRYRFIED
jgi:hypothetical protein